MREPSGEAVKQLFEKLDLMKTLTMITTFSIATLVAQAAWGQGIYSGPQDTTNAIDAAIPSDSDRFVEFANAIDVSRTQFAPRGSTSVSQTGINSLGDLTAAEIADGALPGFLTVTFPAGISNGDGPDFAVFENGFVFPSDPFLFAELAYVEVSTNGSDFARFPSISTNTTFAGGSQDFGGFDTTNILNLAGKQAGGFGTPFDLDDLLTESLVVDGSVDLNDIQFLRLVDIPGTGDFLDSLGNPILDVSLTTGTGGFDFSLAPGQGVGVINRVSSVPEPSSLAVLGLATFGLMLSRGRRRRHAVGNQN